MSAALVLLALGSLDVRERAQGIARQGRLAGLVGKLDTLECGGVGARPIADAEVDLGFGAQVERQGRRSTQTARIARPSRI